MDTAQLPNLCANLWGGEILRWSSLFPGPGSVWGSCAGLRWRDPPREGWRSKDLAHAAHTSPSPGVRAPDLSARGGRTTLSFLRLPGAAPPRRGHLSSSVPGQPPRAPPQLGRRLDSSSPSNFSSPRAGGRDGTDVSSPSSPARGTWDLFVAEVCGTLDPAAGRLWGGPAAGDRPDPWVDSA